MNDVEGGCLCGATRYRITGEPVARSVCHCRSCRRASGAASVAWIVVRAEDFAIASGPPASFRSSAPVERTFCPRCGTPLTYRHDQSPATIDVATATLDVPDRYPPTCEIWLEYKIAWSAFDPALPRYRRTRAEGIRQD